MSVDALARKVTGREESLFAGEMRRREAALRGRIEGRRLLVLGGGGSIGSATVHVLSRLGPAALHVVDQSENALAELVRSLRGRPEGLQVSDFRALPLDLGAPPMARLLAGESPYDIVLNFAALKHVRSEKDVPSVLQLLDTNVGKARRLLGWLGEHGAPRRYFAVSTDKAASPANVMGASKRLMEHLVFNAEALGLVACETASARFANVAFSDGSLLQAFLLRLQKRQPLAAPRDTRRYFLTPAESGELCALAAVLADDRHVLVPALTPEADLRTLEEVASVVLEAVGLEPRRYDDEGEARRAVESDAAQGRWPLLLTPRDTVGEKDEEVFLSAGERARPSGLEGLEAVAYTGVDVERLRRVLDRIDEAVARADVPITKEALVSWIAEVVPEFSHLETGRSLDERL